MRQAIVNVLNVQRLMWKSAMGYWSINWTLRVCSGFYCTCPGYL